MAPSDILAEKTILAVDDEPDVLDTLGDLLEDHQDLILHTATRFEQAQQLLYSHNYDLAILDIMGVRGFDLLNVAVHLGFPAVMLTAHALSVESLQKSIEMGARAFIPKEKMMDIESFLEDVLTLEHQSALMRSFERLGGFFSNRFGSKWQEDKKRFWHKVTSGQYVPEPVILKKT